MKKSLFIFMTALLIFACTEQSEEPTNPHDTIGLSPKSLVFSSRDGVQSTKVSGDLWSTEAFVSSKSYIFIQNAISLNGIDASIFIYEWVSVQKIGLNELCVTVENNTTGKERSVAIQLSSGNYFDYLIVSQKSK